MSLNVIHWLCTTLQVALMYDEVHGHQLIPSMHIRSKKGCDIGATHSRDI